MQPSLITIQERPLRRTRGRRAVLAGLALMSLAACGGSGGSDDVAKPAGSEAAVTEPAANVGTTADTQAAPVTDPAPETAAPTEPPTTPAPTEPPAPAVEVVVEGAVSVSGAPTTGAATANAGDVIETKKGTAALSFADGSIVRLDANTIFTVGDTSRGTVQSGTTWHRVAPQAGGDGYVVDVKGLGPVAAKGTAFAIGCTDGTCTLVVLDGEVTFDGTTVKAGQSLALTAAGEANPTFINWDSSFGNDFLKTAANADAAANPSLADATRLAEKIGPSFASFKGTLQGSRTVTSCVPDTATSCVRTPVGDVGDREYSFEVDCSKGFPCFGAALTQFQRGDEVESDLVPVTFDGATISWQRSEQLPTCDNGDGTTSGLSDGNIAWSLTPTAAAVVDGVYRVTAAKGEVISTATLLEPSVGEVCDDATVDFTQNAGIEVTSRP